VFYHSCLVIEPAGKHEKKITETIDERQNDR
jgi:hypothetical protein